MTRPEIEPRSPEPLANTLTIMPMTGKLLLICNFPFHKTKLHDMLKMFFVFFYFLCFNQQTKFLKNAHN